LDLAGHRAGLAAHALIEINDYCQLSIAISHSRPHLSGWQGIVTSSPTMPGVMSVPFYLGRSKALGVDSALRMIRSDQQSAPSCRLGTNATARPAAQDVLKW
jgi:hypothetical protein